VRAPDQASANAAALWRLLAQLMIPAGGGYTPSDFPRMRLSQAKLDELLLELEEETDD
jgi:hypothetical protein